MELAYRKAEPEEIKTAFQLLKEATEWLREQGVNYWQNWLDPEPPYQNWIRQGFDRGEFYLVQHGQAIAGMFRLQYEDEMFWGQKNDKAGYIHSFTTRRELAGKGAGRLILNHVAEQLEQEGRAFLRLDCGSSNSKLCRYYEDNGFKTVGKLLLNGDEMNLYERALRRGIPS